MLKYKKLSFAILMSLGLAACGGGSGGNSQEGNQNEDPVPSVSDYSVSVLAQGLNAEYLGSSRVCYDLNDNGACDEGETITATDDSGKATINLSGIENINEHQFVT